MVPDHGKLSLSVPATFGISTQTLAEPPSVILQIRPATGNAFAAKITVVWLDSSNPNRATPGAIRTITQNAGMARLDTAVEKTITIQDMNGPQTVAAYFVLTDRNPKPGEFKYLTQGTYSAGELMGAFMILSNDPNAPEVSQTLRMLKAATYSRAGRTANPSGPK